MAMTEQQRARLAAGVERHLTPGEEVVDVTMGSLHELRKGKDRARATSVVVTDRRVLFYRKRLSGYDLRARDLAQIAAVDQGHGVVAGELRLTTRSGEIVRVTSMPKDDVERIADAVRRRLTP